MSDPTWIKGIPLKLDTSSITNLMNGAATELTGIADGISEKKMVRQQAQLKSKQWRQKLQEETNSVFRAVDEGIAALKQDLEATGVKMVLLSPFSGNLNTASTQCIAALTPAMENFPDFSETAYSGGIIAISRADNLLASLIQWVTVAFTLFGNKSPVMASVIDALQTPLLSPLGDQVAKDLAFIQKSQQEAFDNPVGSNLFSSLPNNVIQGFADWFNNSTIGQVATGNSVLSEFMGIPKSEALLAREALEELKRTLPELAEDPPPTLGDKIKVDENGVAINFNAIKDEFLARPYDVWYNLVNFNDIHGGLGQILDTANKIVKDTQGVTNDIFSGTDAIISAAENIQNVADGIVTQNFNEAASFISGLKDDVGLQLFDLMLIPPTLGGTEKMRYLLREYMSTTNPEAPTVPEDSSMLIFMLVFGSATLTDMVAIQAKAMQLWSVT